MLSFKMMFQEYLGGKTVGLSCIVGEMLIEMSLF